MRHAINILRILANPRIVWPALRAFVRLQLQERSKTQGKSTFLEKKGAFRRICALEFLRRWLRRERFTRHAGRWVLNSFFPPFPGRAYRRLFTAVLEDEWLPRHSAFLAVTQDCPSDCWHCSMKYRQCNEPLGREQWLRVISELNRIGVSLIGLTGGEPLTLGYLPDLVDAAHQGGAEVEVFTSGIGLTESKAKALSEAGLWAIGVSLDRVDKETVNRMRGNPIAFDAAMAALTISRRHGFYTFINAVVDREAVLSKEYERLHGLARQLGIHELRLIEPFPCGNLAYGGESHLLSPEHVTMLRQFHRKMNRRGCRPRVCAFSEIESAELFGCGAGVYHVFIDPAGNVCPCDFAPLSFGNVQHEKLKDILRRMGCAMKLPKRYCIMKERLSLISEYAKKSAFPLLPDASCQIVADVPVEPLPDYFEAVAKPLGFLHGLMSKYSGPRTLDHDLESNPW